MSDFVPPFPPRPRERLSTLKLISAGRRNMIAIWPEKAFEAELISTRVLTRRVFICNSPDTVQYALVDHNSSFERKSPQQRHALAPLIGDGLFVSDGETWRTRRRIVAPIIHVSRLPVFAPTMVATALDRAHLWKRRGDGAEINALGEMAELTAEIICRTIFGQRLGYERANEIVDGFSDYQRRVDMADVLSLFGLPDWLPRWRSRGIGRSSRRIHAVLEDILNEHRRGRGDETSVIGLLLNARDPETSAPLDGAALRNEAAVIFMAGHETTANSLAWTWYLLSQASEAEARFHAEIDDVLGDHAPTLADVPKLIYTRAVFEEALRLYPPVPFLGRQALVDERIRNREVPKGSTIIVVPWLLHRHRKLWDRPDQFVPERFLPNADPERSKYAYVPFAIGPRICAGAAFGLTEAILCLAILGRRFRLRLKPGTDVMPVCRLTLRPGDRLPMYLQWRD